MTTSVLLLKMSRVKFQVSDCGFIASMFICSTWVMLPDISSYAPVNIQSSGYP